MKLPMEVEYYLCPDCACRFIREYEAAWTCPYCVVVSGPPLNKPLLVKLADVPDLLAAGGIFFLLNEPETV